MRRLFTMIFVFWTTALLGQSSVFVLVDVSGSVPNTPHFSLTTKSIIRDLCKAKFNPAGYPDWQWYGVSDPALQSIIKGQGSSLIDPAKDGLLLVMPVGSKDTYKNFRMVRLSDLAAFDGHFEAFYPSVFKDANTFIEIARARAASLAKSEKITSYYLIEVSDQDEDTNRDVQYDDQEKELIAGYGSSASHELKLGTYWYGNNQFRIEVKRVNISSINIKPIAPDSSNVVKSLSFIKPKGGTSAKPNSHQGPIAWKCDGCPQNTEFTITARYMGPKTGVAPLSKKVKGSYQTTLSFNEPGVYQLSVSGAGMSAKSAYADIKLPKKVGPNGPEEGGGCGAFPLLIFLGVAGGIYFLWKRSKQKPSPPTKKYGEEDRPNRGSRTKSNESDNSINDMGTF